MSSADWARKLTRRQLVGAAAGTAAGAAALGTPLVRKALADGPRIPVGRRGIILFTVRDRISAAPDTTGVPYGFERVLFRLAEIGYRQVEFAGYNQSTQILGRQITPTEIRTILDTNGLEANGTHTSIPSTITDATLSAFRAQCQTAATLGMKFIGTGNDPTGSNFKADWDAAAERWNTLGEIARTEFGLRLYTHNHDAAYNFLLDSGPLDALGRPTRSSGVRKLEYFFDLADKKFVFFEMDVYWAHVAQHRWRTYTDPDGNTQTDIFDPAATVAPRTTRFPLFHFKDGLRTADPPGVGSGYVFVPFGTGNIDFKAFVDAIGAAKQHNPNYEQDNAPGGAANPGQSMAFAEVSYQNMAAL